MLESHLQSAMQPGLSPERPMARWLKVIVLTVLVTGCCGADVVMGGIVLAQYLRNSAYNLPAGAIAFCFAAMVSAFKFLFWDQLRTHTHNPLMTIVSMVASLISIVFGIEFAALIILGYVPTSIVPTAATGWRLWAILASGLFCFSSTPIALVMMDRILGHLCLLGLRNQMIRVLSKWSRTFH